MRSWLPPLLWAALAAAVFLEILTIAPRFSALVIPACAAWMAFPGVVLVRRVARGGDAARIAAWLLGPALGLGFSVFGLLLLWGAGIQGWASLLLAPCFSWLLVWLAGRWGGPSLRLPAFDRRDLLAVALTLCIVPAITWLPYAHVRQPLPDGDAYRAYFTADFIWAMTVTGDIAKGELPPVNPFLKAQPLHYYWMSHLLSGAIYRDVKSWGITIEQVILLDGLAFGLVFVPFFYGLVRITGGSAMFSALAVLAAFAANSYEGIERLWELSVIQQPWSDVRLINIDAVTRWYYQGMPVDGLQRMLLYQPHHLTGYVFALAAIWLVGCAEDVTETSVALWAGILLGFGLLFSTFTAVIAGPAVALLFGVRLLRRRAWNAAWQAAVLGAMPLAVALALCTALGYTDSEQGFLIRVGLNPVAVRHVAWVLLLNFGPLLFAGAAVVLRPRWLIGEGSAAAVLVIGAFAFYFFTDVPDQEGVWVGWRSGHLLLVGFAAMAAALLTAAWRTRTWRVPLLAVLLLLILPAMPTVAIDVYNAQDISNRERGPTFPWTVIITPQERAALEWVRHATPEDATVQTDPRARHSATWAYVQAFAERRGVAGLPGSMIPIFPYLLATENVSQGIYRAARAEDALGMAHAMGIDFLWVGKPERERSPNGAAMFAAHPELFVPVFRNDEVVVYDVRRR